MTTTFTPMALDSIKALSKTIDSMPKANLAIVGTDQLADAVERAAALSGRDFTIMVDGAYAGFLLMEDTDIKKVEPVAVAMTEVSDDLEDWYNRAWAAEDAADLADVVEEPGLVDGEDDVWSRMMEKYRE